MSENKRDRFVRIAEARTNRALENIRLLGNCSNKVNYEYSDEDIKKIFNALEKQIKTTKNKFLGIAEADEKFSLG